MKKLLADVRGIYAVTFRLLTEPKVLKTHIVVGFLYGAIIVVTLLAVVIGAILFGNIDIEHASVGEAAVLAGIALVLFLPSNLLISRLIHFAAAEQPRPRYFRDFRISRKEWINSFLLVFLIIVSTLISVTFFADTEGATGIDIWINTIFPSVIFTAISIPILMPVAVLAAHDPHGWKSARTWIFEMFAPMFIAYLLLTIASSVVSLPLDWALATTDSGADMDSGDGVLRFLGVFSFAVLLLFAIFVMTFAIIAGGYRYWREAYVP